MRSDKYFEKYLDTKFEEYDAKINDLKDYFDKKFEEIKEAIIGEGDGLLQRVEDLEGFKQYVLGTTAVLASIIGMAGALFVDWVRKIIGLK